MAQTLQKNKLFKGGSFLIQPSSHSDTFIPEEFTEEQAMIIESIKDFIDQNITPNVKYIEKQKDNIALKLLGQFGELGFLSTHMPEYLGGLDLDFNSNTIVGEVIGRCGSFSVAYNAHTGIGMLPILYFGTKDQKEKYLPDLMSGVKGASYCLTEPSSGSDALSAKTTAILSEDKQYYILNGQKMWITNAGFAHIFIVFAQVDNDKFTAFIVERDAKGLSFGEEEDKLGIKGSSTRMVFFENVKIPKENLLGEIGKGHSIAFNVLNIGRFKLGSSVLGGAKEILNKSIRYANERYQFDRAISTFGAIQEKISKMVVRTFATECVLYRISHLINKKIAVLLEQGIQYENAKLQAAKEYALECSIIKVLGSEALDFCVDENVQIHGGMGYSEEGSAARAYRDSRINRIFEGTNEINRLVIINTLLRKVIKGEIDIVSPALAVQAELKSNSEDNTSLDGLYVVEQQILRNHKKLLLMMFGTAAKLNMEKKIDLKESQEITMRLSDMIMDIFELESVILRIQKVTAIDRLKCDLNIYESILKVSAYEINQRMYNNGLDLIGGLISDENTRKKYVFGLRKYTNIPFENTIELRRKIAKPIIEANNYILD